MQANAIPSPFISDASHFRAYAQDIQESRGTSDCYYAVQNMIAAALIGNDAMRELSIRFLTRLNLTKVELQPPAEWVDIRMRAAREERI